MTDVELTITKTKTDTHTIVYECIKGYESKDGIEEVVSRCNSTDTDNIPWMWSNISLTCTPGICKYLQYTVECRYCIYITYYLYSQNYIL